MEDNADPAALMARMAKDLADIERMHMPFGKHGPAAHPPHGCPLYDLPAEYLAWFEKSQRGWPKGRLGELMRMVYQMKVDGSDLVAFDPMRRRAGGKTDLREKKRLRHFSAEDL
jgi:uncharacterized protein (DUF3820 family)